MKKFLLSLGMAALMMGAAYAQQPAPRPEDAPAPDKPHGEAIITLFEHAGIGYSHDAGEWNSPAFEMERAYFGYRYHINPEWTATVIFDASESNGTSLEHVFVKNAFVNYHKGAFSLNAGIIPTVQGTQPEANWGYRYIYKAFYDVNGWGNTADMGIGLKYQVADWMSADLSILNGEGFKKIQLDEHFLYGLGLTFYPVKGLNLRVYGDVKTCDDTTEYGEAQKAQTNLAFSAGYDHPRFSVGCEYNIQNNHSYVESHNMTGFSAYATGKLCPKFNVFARYDNGASTDADNVWNYDKDGYMVMCGVQWKINKHVAIAPAYRYSYSKTADQATSYAYLSAKISL